MMETSRSEQDHSDEVLVEGSWFRRSELPKILGNFMRLSEEYARQVKDAIVTMTELRSTVVTDDMVKRAAKALWIEDQDDKFWAHSVVDDVFSPADDWPDDCIGYAIRARSALVSALGVSDA